MSADRPGSFLGLPEYPSDPNAPVPSYRRGPLIVEVLAGGILGCLVGGAIGVFQEEILLILLSIPAGLMIGAIVGAVVGKITGPTGELTGKTLVAAMLRVVLVVLFGTLLGALGIAVFPKEHDDD